MVTGVGWSKGRAPLADRGAGYGRNWLCAAGKTPSQTRGRFSPGPLAGRVRSAICSSGSRGNPRGRLGPHCLVMSRYGRWEETMAPQIAYGLIVALMVLLAG